MDFGATVTRSIYIKLGYLTFVDINNSSCALENRVETSISR